MENNNINEERCNKKQKDHTYTIILTTLECVDNYIPVIGPFMDLPIIDLVEQQVVKTLVDAAFTENNSALLQETDSFMIWSA